MMLTVMVNLASPPVRRALGSVKLQAQNGQKTRQRRDKARHAKPGVKRCVNKADDQPCQQRRPDGERQRQALHRGVKISCSHTPWKVEPPREPVPRSYGHLRRS